MKRSLNRARVWKNMSVREFTTEMGKAGYAAKRVSEAVDIYKAMIADKNCIKVVCAAGALIAAGMRKIFVEMFNHKLVDVFITTGAILTHDLIEAFGVHHIQGSAAADDCKLADENTVRIYDVLLDKSGYSLLEERIQKILPKLPQEELSPMQFLQQLGNHIKDKNSIIRACSENKIPIFCPSITDSMLGFQIWMYSQQNKLKINPQLDIRDIMDIVWQDKTFGALILGGGVPKHFIAGMMQASGKSLDYAIQITLDRPEHGGVSGAHLKEAKSWKKVSKNALITDVVCDVSLAFPLIVASLI
jgi:deoxyhypusine synthase